ncbi:MAG: hypothetical protein HY232_00365 [Acidobacteria bacterium]|nr:hypothetical protein [Acidobacteriota bacterium]
MALAQPDNQIPVGEILVAYRQDYQNSTTSCFVARSADDGQTFPTIARVTGPTARNLTLHPRPWFIGDLIGGAHLIWGERNGIPCGNFQIYSSAWKRGETEPQIIPTVVSCAGLTQEADDWEQLAFRANSLFAVWVDNRDADGSQKVRFSRTTSPIY